jgi:hypothetical protein
MRRQDAGFREEFLHTGVEATAELLAPVARRVRERGTEAERIVHGGFKHGAGDGVVFVRQGVEAKSCGFERDGAAAGHRVNDGNGATEYLLRCGVCLGQVLIAQCPPESAVAVRVLNSSAATVAGLLQDALGGQNLFGGTPESQQPLEDLPGKICR